MTIQDIVIDNNHYTVTGIGYEPEGNILLNGQAVSPTEDEKLEMF